MPRSPNLSSARGTRRGMLAARDRWQATLAALDRPVEEAMREQWHRHFPPPPPIAAKPSDAVRLMTFNIAHGRRRVPHQALVNPRRVRRNLKAVAGMIDHTDTDIVALQEADGPSAWSGNFDHVATLARAAGMTAHYRGEHNPFRIGRHTLASGTALMSGWPLRETVDHPFGSSWRCTKGFVAATLAVPTLANREIDVVSVHLDFLAPHKRREQIESMASTLADRGRPLVVLGDLNCCWRREPASMQLLTERLGLRAYQPSRHIPTYPAYHPRRRLDWILVSPEWEFAGHRRVPIKLSDHLGVVADLRLRGA